ncbi:MAG: hypothetical protein ACR2JI_16135 [Mycobacterium sp.]
MRRAIGPIVTTGVAMVAAGVIVANPILVPRADVQIPAVALSAGSDSADMLDASFLDAIAPAAPESTNPFSVLRQLVSALAADASYVGKNAIVDAFVAGVAAVSGPDLSVPATVVSPAPAPIAPPPDLAALVPALTPHLDSSLLTAPLATVSADVTNVTTTFINGSVVPVVEQVVSAVYNDAAYLGKNVLTAAFVVGAAVVAEPSLIGDTLTALVNGDINAALQNAVKAVEKAVTIPFNASMLIVNAVKDIIDNHLDELTDLFDPPGPAVLPLRPIPPAGGVTDVSSVMTRDQRLQDALPVLVQSPRSASTASAVAVSARAGAAVSATDAPRALPVPRQVAGVVLDAVKSVGDQVSAVVQNPAGGGAKALARTRSAAAGR